MDVNEAKLAAELVRDSKGRIVYTYRGGIEKGVGGRYIWQDGYSATTADGGVLYPWMNRRDCQRDAKRFDSVAVFVRGAA